MLCAKCGKEVPPGQQFCGSCGTAVTPDATPAPPIPSQEAPLARGKPRIWVIICGIIATLSCLGAITGIPLIITEVKRSRAGVPVRNTGWLIASGALFVIMMIASIAGNNDQTTRSQTGKATQNQVAPAVPKKEKPTTARVAEKPAPTPAVEQEQNSEYKVGQTVQLENHLIAVTGVATNFNGGDQYEKPENSNNMFVAIHVIIKNTGRKDLAVNSFGFELEDDTGTKRTNTFVSALKDPLETVSLSPDGQVEGNIAFEARKGSQLLKLHYTGGVWSGGEIVVNLKSRMK